MLLLARLSGRRLIMLVSRADRARQAAIRWDATERAAAMRRLLDQARAGRS